jgi:hypothetical protein
MVRIPQAPDAQTVFTVVPPLPGWARNEAPVTDTEADTGADTGAAFQAGAALAALDCRVRAGVPFAGVWRRRLALKAAAASARIARRAARRGRGSAARCVFPAPRRRRSRAGGTHAGGVARPRSLAFARGAFSMRPPCTGSEGGGSPSDPGHDSPKSGSRFASSFLFVSSTSSRTRGPGSLSCGTRSFARAVRVPAIRFPGTLCDIVEEGPRGTGARPAPCS